MAEFVERLKAMRKANYNSRQAELRCDAEHRTENGTSADDLQILMQRAVHRADLRADSYAESRAEHGAETVAAPVGRPVYRGECFFLLFSSSGVICSFSIQVTPLELRGA